MCLHLVFNFAPTKKSLCSLCVTSTAVGLPTENAFFYFPQLAQS
jgi:hypothetical protein